MDLEEGKFLPLEVEDDDRRSLLEDKVDHDEPSPLEDMVEEDERPALWKVWAMAARPHTLTASLVPLLVGYYSSRAFLPQPEYVFLVLRFLVFSLLIQLGTNLHNDYADFVKGADSETRVGQARATQRGWLTPKETAGAALVCTGCAFLVGFQITHELGNDLVCWFVVVSSIFNVFAYTGGPFPFGYLGLENLSIAYSGLGDIFCFLYFGLIAAIMTPYTQLRLNNPHGSSLELLFGTQIRPCWFTALPVGLLATAILVVNNLRDRHTDVVAEKRTVAVRFGGTFCRVEYTLLVLVSYLVAVFLYWRYDHQRLFLLPHLTLPLAVMQCKAIWTLDGADLNPHIGKTALLQLSFCSLLAVALSQMQMPNNPP